MSMIPGASRSQYDTAVDRAKVKIRAGMRFGAACYQAAREAGIDSSGLIAEMHRRSKARRSQRGRAAKASRMRGAA